MKQYNPKDIEPKWQQIWADTNLYAANLQSDKPKYVAMSMFNYPSGAGIHIGHAMNYTISDVKARFKRQQGYESYHPVGWDAFGLPAENYAIKAGVSPQDSMATIIPSYHTQYKAMGWSNDWSKGISTHLPEYYKWTQWIFLQMHKQGLAYQDSRMQWWCDKCQTVLANEQVIDGKCWRHDGPDDPPVAKREVKQWFFKITDYADELLEAIDDLEWTESVKLAQKNWIGRSAGAEIVFKVQNSQESITVFTTRPDTLFGATFMVLAPEHDLVLKIVSKAQKAVVEDYIKQSAQKTEVERQASKQKTGVFTGAYAINPATKNEVPIWIADYVLAGYGTGAIMAVPAHDERDNEFAKKHDLPIIQVIAPIQLDDDNPPRGDKENTKRRVVMCLIKHPEEDKYLTLKWRKQPWHNLVMGGIEQSEDALGSGQREIREETGYTNMVLQRRLPLLINSHFYAAHKDLNRDILTEILEFKLENLEQIATSKEAHEDFESVWIDAKDLGRLKPVSELPFILRWLEEGEFTYEGEGVLINSGAYDDQPSNEVREKIVADLAQNQLAQEKINYKMRDWSVSRQRYWGAPIPIVNCQKCGAVLVPEQDLPVELPELTDFQPSGDGRSALARATDWVQVECPECGGAAERETDTLDTYLDSSWYMFRYFDPHNEQQVFQSDRVNKWLPIDFYNGGDHATAHLLYARFISRFFTKLGLIDHPEPFKQMLFNGKVTAQDGTMFSKSKGTGVDPLDIINSGYGADALRLYLMFAAPLELWIRWDPQGVPGTYRFLNRLWNLVQEYTAAAEVTPNPVVETQIQRAVHRMVKKITADLEANRYNTAIAEAMGTLNALYKLKTEFFSRGPVWQQVLEAVVACIAPFAPHIAEELWQDLGHTESVHAQSWPAWDEALIQDELATIVVQINGKVRANVAVPADVDEQTMVETARNDVKVAKYLAGGSLVKTVTVPGKLVNFVVKQ